ncbi:hypothetical protein ACFVWX_23045 [Streptomyces sp. NPDC058220]|uniref:hypothetical protein n=1 Tax=Streptomyces sp. NPDC058220 TaxID=3346387 RepID=UPI0036E0706B
MPASRDSSVFAAASTCCQPLPQPRHRPQRHPQTKISRKAHSPLLGDGGHAAVHELPKAKARKNRGLFKRRR